MQQRLHEGKHGSNLSIAAVDEYQRYELVRDGETTEFFLRDRTSGIRFDIAGFENQHATCFSFSAQRREVARSIRTLAPVIVTNAKLSPNIVSDIVGVLLGVGTKPTNER